MSNSDSPFDHTPPRFSVRHPDEHWEHENWDENMLWGEEISGNPPDQDQHCSGEPSGGSDSEIAGETRLESQSGRRDRRQRELDRLAGVAKPKMMSVPLHILVPLLIDAQEQNATWLADFANDLVKIDSDLHEVLLAYGNLRHRQAG